MQCCDCLFIGRIQCGILIDSRRCAEDVNAYDVNAYDVQMQAYYQSRGDNQKTSNWSEQTAGAVQKKKREHMLSFLQKQGFLKR